ncbi:uncharacterized protein [Procambarus clarkii]|uniref:uncharacterized protein n=1 Tax=Procambarus clarkii TaxID=6728 RepID=UPI0037448CF4
MRRRGRTRRSRRGEEKEEEKRADKEEDEKEEEKGEEKEEEEKEKEEEKAEQKKEEHKVEALHYEREDNPNSEQDPQPPTSCILNGVTKQVKKTTNTSREMKTFVIRTQTPDGEMILDTCCKGVRP